MEKTLEKTEVTYRIVDGPTLKQIQSASFCDCDKCKILKFTILSSRDERKEYWEVYLKSKAEAINDEEWRIGGPTRLTVPYRSSVGYRRQNRTYCAITHSYTSEIIYNHVKKTGVARLSEG